MRPRLAIGYTVLAVVAAFGIGALWRGTDDDQRERTTSVGAGTGTGGGVGANLEAPPSRDPDFARATGRCVLEGLVLRGRDPAPAAIEVRWSAMPAYFEADARDFLLQAARDPAARLVWSGRAGVDGRFVGDRLPAGRWEVTAVAADGARSERAVVATTDGVREVVTLSLLAATETLRGEVLGDDGRPTPCRLLAAGRLVEVGADGTFEVRGLCAGPCDLAAEGPECAWADALVRVPRTTPLTLRLRRPARERVVHVLASPGGAPIEGAKIHTLGCLAPVATTDRDGRARVPLGGRGFLEFTAEGFATVAKLASQGDATDEWEVRLRKAARIAGCARSAADGRALEGVLVEASAGDYRASTPAASAVSGADGTYVLDDLVPGPFTVVARGKSTIVRGLESMPADDDFGSIRRERLECDPLLVDVPPGTTTLDLEMVPGAVLRGRVLDAAGSPVGGAEVVVYAPRAPYISSTPDPVYWERYAAATGPDGRYEFAALIPGRLYTVQASAPGSGTHDEVRAPARGGAATLDLRLPPSFSFDVRVVDDATGAGLTGVLVGPASKYGSPVAPEMVTGEDGWVRLGPVPDTVASVFAWRRRGGTRAEQSIDLSKGPPAFPLVLRLPAAPSEETPDMEVLRVRQFVEWEEFARHQAPFEHVIEPGGREDDSGATFTVTVLDADGAAIPTADLVWWDSGARHGKAVSVVDGVARLAVPETVANRLWVHVRRPRDRDGAALPLGPARVGPLDAEAGRAEIRLPAERTMRGRVVGPDGRGVRGIRLYAVPVDWAELEGHTFSLDYAEAYTDGTGDFHLRGLAAGAHFVAFHVPPEFAPRLPSLREAGERGIEFRLRPADVAAVRLLDPVGRPVVGASVFVTGIPPRVQRLPQDLWSGPRVGGESGADGVVRIAGMSRDVPCSLRATPPAGRDDLRELEIDAWFPDSGDLTIPGLAVVRGVIRGADEAPIARAHVEALIKNRWVSIGRSELDGAFVVRVATDGTTQLEGVVYEVERGDPDGIYWGERVEYRSAPVEVEAGATGVTLVVDRGVDLTVHVADSGPRAGWGPGVSYDGVLYDEGPVEQGGYRAGFKGRIGRDDEAYHFHQLRAGKTYTFWLAPDLAGFYVLASGLRAEKGGAEVTVKAEKGRPIRGRLVGAANVERTTITAVQGVIRVYGQSAPDGSFEFAGLPEGGWQLHADVRRDEGVWTARVAARAGDEHVDLRLEPPPGK